MSLKTFLDKVIIERGGGTYEIVSDSLVKASFPVGKDENGIPTFHKFSFNPQSGSFPLALDWKEDLIRPEDMQLLKGAEGLVDAAGTVFDADVHMVNKEGAPVLAGGKYFRKKKADAA